MADLIDIDDLNMRARASFGRDVPVNPNTLLCLVAIAAQMPDDQRRLRAAEAKLDAIEPEAVRLREVQAAALDLCDAWDASGFSRKHLVKGSPGDILYRTARAVAEGTL